MIDSVVNMIKATIIRRKLTKVYRQTNIIDGHILSRVRSGTVTSIDLKTINRNVTDAPPPGAIVICEYNRDVTRFNRAGLKQINEPMEEYDESVR